MFCEHLIAADIAANCASPIRAGVEAVGYIINKADIKSVTEEDGIVSVIDLLSGKRAYQIQQLGQQPFNGTNNEFVEGDYMNTFNKTVAFAILNNSPSVSKDIIEPLANGEFVVIIENKYKVDSLQNAFEIIGLEAGARMSSANQNKYDNQSAWTVELLESEVPTANKFVWNETYVKTKEMLDNLLVPAP